MAIPAEIEFIDANYIRKYTPVNHAVDAEILRPAVYTAQDMYIQNSLGTDLYNKLKTEISAGTLAGVYLTLHQTYVMKATLWWTMVNLYPFLWVKHDNGNIVHRFSESTNQIDAGTYDRLVDQARSNAQFYTTRLEEYLCHNASSFPEFTSNTSPDIYPGTSGYTRGATMFGRSANRNNGLSNPEFFPFKISS